MENKAELKQKIDNWFKQNEDEFINDLSKLIAINSVEGPAEEGMPYGKESRAVLEAAKIMMEKNGCVVETFEDIVISSDFGNSEPLVGVLAHLDIVAAGEGWDTDPFTLTEKDGKLFGRGVMDNKGPSVAAMYAMYCARELFPNLTHGYRIILGSGEETGCTDVKQYLKKNQAPPNVFTPDAQFPIVNVEKGRFYFPFEAQWEESKALPRVVSISGGKTANVVPNLSEAVVEGFELSEVEAFCAEYSKKTGATLSAKKESEKIFIKSGGKAAHAARPDTGVNAQTALLAMLAAMPFAQCKGFEYICALNQIFPHGDYNGDAIGLKMSDEVSGELTLNFGVVNYEPTKISGNFDSRTPQCADAVDILGISTAKLVGAGFTVGTTDLVKSHVTGGDTPFVQTLSRIYEQYTGEPGECLAIGGSTYVHGIPGGVVFGCAMPGSENNVHGPNEYIDKEQLFMCAKMFAQVIIEMCI